MNDETRTLRLWRQLTRYPGGRWLFSQVIAFKAPYFRSIAPRLIEVRPNHVQVFMKKRRRVENHIGTVHVIAICNLLEIAMGACAEASIPKHLRWIPKGMTVAYPAKAGTDITATAQINPDDWRPGELPVTVTACDAHGTVVVKGVITLWISEKKPPH